MPARRRPEVKPHHDEMQHDFEKHHERMERFPSLDELREIDAMWGIDRSLNPSEITLRFQRHVTSLAGSIGRSGLPDLDVRVPLSNISIILSPWIWKLIMAIMRPRVNHQTLDAAARDRFNQALQAAHADGSYQAVAVIHSESHNMHTGMGNATSTERFLPWHRQYLFEMENVLRKKQPGVTIPYWDYANDHARPDWVWQPSGVVRNTPGAAGGTLPTQSTIDTIMQNSAYYSFSQALEFGAHNQVHNWCNGTITTPSTASNDPIFFLLHANVDRIWDMWQLNHTDVPKLTGPAAVMDPWATTAAELNDVIDVGYSYK
jgi:tyrosinase